MKHLCQKHGEYEAREVIILGNVINNDRCPQCNKEINDKEKKILEEREKAAAMNFKQETRTNAGISKRNLYKTFDDFIVSNKGQSEALKQCKEFAENFPQDARNILMLGGVGTGKTLLASMVIEELIKKHDCRIVNVIDIFREIKATYSRNSKETEIEVIKRFRTIPLLIIDEVGVQFDSDVEKLLIFDIVDGRYKEMLPTILISNLDVKGVEGIIGTRCLDRLREGGGRMIAFDWGTMRR